MTFQNLKLQVGVSHGTLKARPSGARRPPPTPAQDVTLDLERALKLQIRKFNPQMEL